MVKNSKHNGMTWILQNETKVKLVLI